MVWTGHAQTEGCGDVTLRNVVSGHGGVGLDWMILEAFSNLYSSMRTTHIHLFWPIDIQALPAAERCFCGTHCFHSSPTTIPGRLCRTRQATCSLWLHLNSPFLLHILAHFHSLSEEFASTPCLQEGMSILMLPSTLSLSLVYLNCNVLGAGTLTHVWISISLM